MRIVISTEVAVDIISALLLRDQRSGVGDPNSQRNVIREV